MQTTSVKVPQIVDEVNIQQECPATLDTEKKKKGFKRMRTFD